jgi:hypothetical protein
MHFFSFVIFSFFDFLEKIRNNDCLFTSSFDLRRPGDHFRLNKDLSTMRRKRTICAFVNSGLMSNLFG